MCGIIGILGDAGSYSAEALSSAVDVMAHRGPDGRGEWSSDNVWLGHRRLSIIDLSSGGSQPVVDEGSRTALTFNGEIYNYIELRDELGALGHRFRSQSDSEVLLRAYIEWGEGCLNKLNGMFAFAIWDGKKQECLIVRDRFSVKPLYFQKLSNHLVFASEPKAILTLTGQRNIAPQALYDFLAKGELYLGGESFYENIKYLPAAHAMIVSARGDVKRTFSYWDYPTLQESSAPPQKTDEDIVSDFQSLFDDAVTKRMRSDVTVGITLSGGIDSTAILASFMSHGSEAPACYTSSYGGHHYDEVSWAKKACKPYDFEPRQVIAKGDEWLNTMQDVAWHMDGPGYSPAVFPLWNIMKRARQENVPVLLEGQGADEAFAGYPQYVALALVQKFGNAPISELTKGWRNFVELGGSRVALLWIFRTLFPSLVYFQRKRVNASLPLRSEFTQYLDKSFSVGAAQGVDQYGYDRVGERLMWDHSRQVLPGLLQYGDTLSMAHSIEARQPFLDYRLVEWIFRNGSDIKSRVGQSKWILREYLKLVNQSDIANRTDKKGYSTPVDLWISENNYEVFRDAVMTTGSKLSDLTDVREIEKLIKAHKKGHYNAGNHLFRLLSTELWMRRCL